MRGPGGSSEARFTVAVRRRPREDALVLALDGELDLDSADVLREALAETVEPGVNRILVDCTDLHFCDSTGLNALLRARRSAEEAGARLDLFALRPQVDRMFDITGVGAVFHVYANLDEALTDLLPK